MAGLAVQLTSSVSWYWQPTGSVAAVTTMLPPQVNVTLAVRAKPLLHFAPFVKYCDR
jgi:hypothetical protein